MCMFGACLCVQIARSNIHGTDFHDDDDKKESSSSGFSVANARYYVKTGSKRGNPQEFFFLDLAELPHMY